MTTPTNADGIKPAPDHPFYIVSPPYTRMSAGVSALHWLCHALNNQGENAFMLHYPPETRAGGSLPAHAKLQQIGAFPAGLNAPLITQEAIEFYEDANLMPIVVYPEVYDNPFGAAFFVRYLLNHPGLLAPQYVQEAAYSFAYSRILADRYGADEVVYVPSVDLSFWNRSGAATRREGSCFYAGKLRQILGGAPASIPPDAVEIPRGAAMSREAIRALFWQSEAFYCLEDSALATEAMLCGCPTVFVPNDHFDGVGLAGVELGSHGWCRMGEAGGLQRARATVDQVEAAVRATFQEAPAATARVASKVKALVRRQRWRPAFTYPHEPRLVLFDPGRTFSAGFREGEAAALSLERELRPQLQQLAGGSAIAVFGSSEAAQGGGDSAALRAELAAVRASTSWRITAPLRALVTVLRRLRGRAR